MSRRDWRVKIGSRMDSCTIFSRGIDLTLLHLPQAPEAVRGLVRIQVLLASRGSVMLEPLMSNHLSNLCTLCILVQALPWYPGLICLGSILRRGWLCLLKDQQCHSPLAHTLATSSCCGNSDIDCHQLWKLVRFQHFKILLFQGILHVLESPCRLAAPTQKFCPARIFLLFLFVWDLWRPIRMLGVAVQTCLGGTWPMAGIWGFVQLSPRLSDLLHVLRLPGT